MHPRSYSFFTPEFLFCEWRGGGGEYPARCWNGTQLIVTAWFFLFFLLGWGGGGDLGSWEGKIMMIGKESRLSEKSKFFFEKRGGGNGKLLKNK